MLINFTVEDIEKLNGVINDLPFKYAYPLFKFFNAKILEANKIEQEKIIKDEQNNPT